MDADGGFQPIVSALQEPQPVALPLRQGEERGRGRGRGRGSSREGKEERKEEAGGQSGGEGGEDGECVAPPLLRSISCQMAEGYFQKGEPLLAACCHLAVDDGEGALRKLLKGNEVWLLLEPPAPPAPL